MRPAWFIDELGFAEHSTFTWLLEPMMRRCGFEIARAEHSDDGAFASYV